MPGISLRTLLKRHLFERKGCRSESNFLAGGTTVKQSRVRYCILENAPLSELTKYINQRYITDESGVYFNASSIQNATMLATVSDMEPYVLEIDNEDVTVDSYVVTIMSPEMRN